MADQRPFRFRLPWLSAPVAPALRPTAEPQPPRPRVEIQAPARPITTIPIQRPPFRPAGITPAMTPTTQTTAQEQTEPQPMPPRRAAIESQVNSQPVSESRETRAASVPPSPSRETPQSRAASVSPSPSRAKTQSQAASQTQSPSRATPQSRAASVAPSPSRTTSQPQSAAAVTVPQTQSSSRLATQVPGRKSPQLSSPSKTATQVQPTVSQSPSKKLQLATQEISQPPPKYTQSETQQEETKPTPAAEPVQASDAVTAPAPTPTPTPEPALETPASLKKSDSRTIGANHPMPLSQPVKRVKEDIFERKKTTTISPNGETIKTARTRYAFGESHQKTSMSNGEKVPLQKEIREDISKFVHKLGMEHMKHPIGEKPVSVVTLAGENRGATMHVGSESSRKVGSVHIHRGYKINPDESSEATTDGEGSSRGRSSKDLLTKEDPARKAYINSNTQSVSNSILFETSVSERSPGVHLCLSYNDEEPSKNSSKPVRLETRKAEFQVTPSEKLSNEPKVRRRCLRGLFLESSDSDPDNPEKPRRHGCRYSCGQERKDKDIGVLRPGKR